MKKYAKNLTVQIVVAAVAGIVFGLIVGPWTKNIEFVGNMFIRLIQMSMVPLIMTSVIAATGGMSGKGAGKLAGRTFAWDFGLAIAAAICGWILAVVIKPGQGMVFTGHLDPGLQDSAAKTSGWQDTILNFVSKNIFSSMSTADMVPIIVFSLIFGAALNSFVAKTGNELVLNFFQQAQQIVLIMIRFVMMIAPIGIFCLLADLTGEVGFSVVTTALKYLGTTMLGVIIMMILFGLFVCLRAKLNPALMPAKFGEQTLIAITTTSSAVTFPTILKNAIEKFGVSPRVANFSLPICLTMGAKGAVLNYVIVVFFLAQAGGMHLAPGAIVMAILLSLLLNLGTVTVPGGFPVIAMFLATTLGLPFQAVGLLIAVDWFAGMFRTFLNVNGDTIVSLLVAHDEKEIDHDVYNGKKVVNAGDLIAIEESREDAELVPAKA
ncbi:dicarboxylate/amino acid:cation symporter [Propionibacterium sp.]|uniref:dicarboxylate/amino acid:cation symporter n=1 Tax=Propionibacterium sp. TaxID=1977903 RepID=UPI0039EBB4DE